MLRKLAGPSDVSTMRYVHISDTTICNEISSSPILVAEDLLRLKPEVKDLRLQLTMRLAAGRIDTCIYNRAMAALEHSSSSEAVITIRMKSSTKNAGRTRYRNKSRIKYIIRLALTRLTR